MMGIPGEESENPCRRGRRVTAVYKLEPKRSLPMRSGPLQCIRNCANCIPKQSNDEMIYPQVDLLNIKSFDNLIIRSGRSSTSYHSVQYHRGQLDVLKQARKAFPCKLFIYIVAVNKDTDVDYLNFVLSSGKSDIKLDLPLPELYFNEDNEPVREYLWPDFYLHPDKNSVAVLIQRTTCVVRTAQLFESYFDIESIRELLYTTMGILRDEGKEFDPFIVPVSVTKDHDITTKFGLGYGTVAVQILEPFLLGPHIETFARSPDTTNMTIHLYHDIFHYAIVLGPNMVAFLTLFLRRPTGATKKDFTEHIKWFVNSAIDLNLHHGFSGEIAETVDYSIIILQPYIKQFGSGAILIKDEDKLMDYANMMVPIVAYYGIIARALIIEYNLANPDKPLTHFDEEIDIEAHKEKVFNTAERLSKELESKLPCKRPCQSNLAKVEEVFDQMSSFMNFFEVKEPAARYVNRVKTWAGDFDVDEDFNQQCKLNDLYQTSIVATKHEDKVDRLNLFMNAIDAYIN